MPSLDHLSKGFDGQRETCGESGRQDRFVELVKSLCDEYQLLSDQCDALKLGTSESPDLRVSPEFQTTTLIDLDQKAPVAVASSTTAGQMRRTMSESSQKSRSTNQESLPSSSQAASFQRGSSCYSLEDDNAETSLAALKDQLTTEYIDKLRYQFDLLDTDEDDKISLDQCKVFVETFVGHELDLDSCMDALRSLHTVGLRKEAPTEATADTDNILISFDEIMHLMGTHSTESSQFDKFREHLQTAFDKAHHLSELLSKRAESYRQRHIWVALLLDVVPAFVIIANAIVIGMRADLPNHETLWNAFDAFFLVFYMLECIVKGCMYGCTVFWCGPDKYWNWFDVFCVTVGLADNILPLFIDDVNELGDVLIMKMLRLVKLTRLVKVMRYPIFAELKIMMMGVVGGLRVLLWALVLLLLIVYFLGVGMNNLIGQNYQELRTVPSAMFTIFRCLTDGCEAYDGTPLQEHIRAEYGVMFVIPYVLTIMFVTFGLFNLIMACFVDNATSNNTKRRQQRLGTMAQSTRRKIQDLFTQFVMHCKASSGGKRRLLTYKQKQALKLQTELDAEAGFNSLPPRLAISSEIFDKWVQTQDFRTMLEENDIDTSNSWDLFEALDSDMDGKLTPAEIVEGLMKLRGPITKVDMIAVRLKVRYCVQLIEDIHAACVSGGGPTYVPEMVKRTPSKG